MAVKPKTTQVKARTTIHAGKKITLSLDTYERDGATRTTEVVRHPGAVVLLPVAEDGSLILIEQYRYAIDRTILELPAGTLEKDEAPATCAAREIIEETGFSASAWVSLGELVPAPGFCDELQYLFLARGLTSAVADADEDEEIETVRLSVEQVEEAIRSGRLSDAKSIATFSRARLLGLI